MIKTYKGFNFIICDSENKLCSGNYFTLIENGSILELIMLKDNSFSFIEKDKEFSFELYISKGNIYKNSNEIRSGKLKRNLFSIFHKKDEYYQDDKDSILKFYSNKIDDGLFLSNPNILIKKKSLDKFIDNL